MAPVWLATAANFRFPPNLPTTTTTARNDGLVCFGQGAAVGSDMANGNKVRVASIGADGGE